MGKWLDVTDDLPMDVEVGQVVIFKKKRKKTYLKIMRKRKGKVWAKVNYLYHPDEVLVKDQKKAFDD